MSNTRFHISFVACILFIAFSQLVDGYWQQHKFDEFRTNNIGFLPKHAEWTTSVPNLYALKDFSSLVLNAKQSSAFAIISNSTSSTQFLQVDLLKGGSKLIDLSGHIKGITPVGAVMDEDNNYYVLAKNFITSNTILVQVNVKTGQVASMQLDNYGTPYSIVYSRTTQLIVIVSYNFIGGFDMHSFNEVWKHENRFRSTFDNSAMLVRGGMSEPEDVVYVMTNVIEKFRVRDGFRFQRIITIPSTYGQPKYMTYLGSEGLIAVISVDQSNGNDYLSSFNYENGRISSVSLAPSCRYPVFSEKITTNVRFLFFNLAIPCSEVTTFLKVSFANTATNLTVHDIPFNVVQSDNSLSLALIPESRQYLGKISNSNLYDISTFDGSSVRTIKSSIIGNECETLTSSNGMLYSFCLLGGSLNIESKTLP